MSQIPQGPVLGTRPKPSEFRDCVHVAIAPMVASRPLLPGEHVGIGPDGRAGKDAPAVGIVDPYLTESVGEGESFWLCVYPQSVTSLRHTWVHPAFAANASRAASPAVASSVGQSFPAEITE